MKTLITFIFLFSIAFVFAQNCIAQDIVSQYKPRTKMEKLVFSKLKSLPEIKEHYSRRMKGAKPDIVFSTPDSVRKNYLFEVGVEQPDRFANSYYLSIDPKTLQVYYWDFDDEGEQDITIEKWRYWRSRPEFNESHKWVKGKLVLTNIKLSSKKKPTNKHN